MNQKRNNDELLTTVFGSKEVLEPAPTDVIPQGMMRPEIAYQIVKDETYPQTQPRLNLATFVTTYMDEYATRLMNEAISVNYIDETEYPRIAVMNGRCINMIANLWNTPEKAQWKAFVHPKAPMSLRSFLSLQDRDIASFSESVVKMATRKPSTNL